MRLLIIGREGQLARALATRRPDAMILSRPRIDLADPASLAAPIRASRPDAIVNAAAYTAVDRAEQELALADAVNGIAPGVIAAVAAELDVPFVHVSTDYVFAGDAARPYSEDDPIAPQSAYGRSKAAGEAAVRASGADHAIVRTAWVYAGEGANFLRTMLRLARDHDEVRVVADQHGAPTLAADLADGILAMLARWPTGGVRKTYHLTNSGSTTWAGFAEAIFAEAAARGLPSVRVEPITTADYPTTARRPAMSVLDGTRLAHDFGITLRPWNEALSALFADRDFHAAMSRSLSPGA